MTDKTVTPPLCVFEHSAYGRSGTCGLPGISYVHADKNRNASWWHPYTPPAETKRKWFKTGKCASGQHEKCGSPKACGCKCHRAEPTEMPLNTSQVVSEGLKTTEPAETKAGPDWEASDPAFDPEPAAPVSPEPLRKCPICYAMLCRHGVHRGDECPPCGGEAIVQKEESVSSEPNDPEHWSDFVKELQSLINKYSKENGSDTPDFILAEYLRDCLHTWNAAVIRREEWYGRKAGNGAAINNG